MSATEPGGGAGTDPPFAVLAAVAGALGPALAPPGLDALLSGITTTARSVFGAAACSIALIDDEADELVFRASAGEGAAETVGLRLPLGRGIAGYVAGSGQSLAVDDVHRDARFAADVAERTGYVPSAILAVPITDGDTVLGVFSVLDRATDAASSDNALRTATAFAAQAAPALELGAVFDDLGRALVPALLAATANLAIAGARPTTTDTTGARPGPTGTTDPTSTTGTTDTPDTNNPTGPTGPTGPIGDADADADDNDTDTDTGSTTSPSAYEALADALRAAAEGAERPDADLAELAALFAELAHLGADERRAATRIVADFTAYARRRRRR